MTDTQIRTVAALWALVLGVVIPAFLLYPVLSAGIYWLDWEPWVLPVVGVLLLCCLVLLYLAIQTSTDSLKFLFAGIQAPDLALLFPVLLILALIKYFQDKN